MVKYYIRNVFLQTGQGSMDNQRDFDNSLEINEKPVPRPR